MHLDASTKKEYIDALVELRKYPVVGTYTVGELTIRASLRSWNVWDEHGNRYEGAARTGFALRQGIATAVNKWMNDRR